MELQVLDRTSSWLFESWASTKRRSRSWAERTPGGVDLLQIAWNCHSADSAEPGQLWALCDCWRFKKPMFACVCWGSRIPWNSNPQEKVYLKIRYNLQLVIFHYRENDDAPAYGMAFPIVSPRIDIPIIPKDPDRILLCDLAGSERLKKSDVRRPVYLTTGRFYLELC